MSGPSCPDATIGAMLRRRLPAAVPHHRTAAAVARARAARALREARRLYTSTNFPGCISLLSISELELSRALADSDPGSQQRAHLLLARVALWLGICQWAAGEPQAAGRSFVRAAQLPFSPAPDPGLLPPELVAAYRRAVAEPREEVACRLDANLTAQHLQVDGKGPTVAGGALKVPAGTHYVVIKVSCQPGDAACEALRRQVGPGGMRSLRLEASPSRCRVQLPGQQVQIRSRITCINPSEAALAPFVAAVTRETGARDTLVIAVVKRQVTLRMHTAGAPAFRHQLVSTLRGDESLAQLVGRSLPLLVGDQGPALVEPVPPDKEGDGGRPPRKWYRRWWVWVVAAGAVAAVATTAAVAASAGSDRVTVVVGR
jgi:hypothetical protein